MGSTASDIIKKKVPAKAKNATSKKKATKKSRSGSATQKKKTVAKKKTTSASKPACKKTTTGKKSSVKKPTAKTAKKTDAASAGEAAIHPDATNPTVAPDDSNSLSWMAAQAASALKAVRANQTERAQALIARAEITPASPAKLTKAPASQVETDISTENDGTSTSIELDKSELTLDTGDVSQPLASNLSAQPVTEAARPPAQEETILKTAGAADTTEKPEHTAMDPAEQKVQGLPAMQAEPEKQQILPEIASPLPASDQNARSSLANEPASIYNDSTQADADIKSSPSQPVTQPAALIATASTNTGNRHPVRRLLIPGIMILVGILGIRNWLSDDETTRHTTTPVISNLEKTAPPTGNKSAAEVTTVVTGEATTKPAAASMVQTDNWSPTSRPGWPESGNKQKSTQASTSNEETPPQDQLQQQGSGVATRIYRPTTPRPGYHWPGYGYYPQQPLQQQPRYQPAYSQPSQLQ